MAQIHNSVLNKGFVRLPSPDDPAVFSLCEHIRPGTAPVLLEITPAPDAVPQECFMNVRDHVERAGGQIIYGWAIWIWPGAFVEAEHHSVWSDGENWHDITPRTDREQATLFLADPSTVYDFETNKRIDNRRIAISASPTVANMLKAVADRTRFFEENSKGLKFTFDRYEFEAIQRRVMECQAEIILEQAHGRGRNEPCICTSGKKFKKCCGPLIIFD